MTTYVETLFDSSQVVLQAQMEGAVPKRGRVSPKAVENAPDFSHAAPVRALRPRGG